MEAKRTCHAAAARAHTAARPALRHLSTAARHPAHTPSTTPARQHTASRVRPRYGHTPARSARVCGGAAAGVEGGAGCCPAAAAARAGAGAGLAAVGGRVGQQVHDLGLQQDTGVNVMCGYKLKT